MEDTLLGRTYHLLETTKLTYRDIAVGADVGFEWLKSFASRRIREAGVEKVQRVHDFLLSHAAPDVPASEKSRQRQVA